MQPMKRILMYLLAIVMVAAGISHFSHPQFFIDIVPTMLPAPERLVAISGVAEVIGGVGLIVPLTRRAAAWGLVALFVAVFPANINMAVNHITPSGSEPMSAVALWMRLPFQGVFIVWAWWFTRPMRSDSEPVVGLE
ncbi:MAG: DoxX family protein [Polyangiaceae bacterium]|nr:DoxX family protein [Polyangiaceae bacterium]